jgi:hypothetical protein
MSYRRNNQYIYNAQLYNSSFNQNVRLLNLIQKNNQVSMPNELNNFFKGSKPNPPPQYNRYGRISHNKHDSKQRMFGGNRRNKYVPNRDQFFQSRSINQRGKINYQNRNDWQMTDSESVLNLENDNDTLRFFSHRFHSEIIDTTQFINFLEGVGCPVYALFSIKLQYLSKNKVTFVSSITKDIKIRKCFIEWANQYMQNNNDLRIVINKANNKTYKPKSKN